MAKICGDCEKFDYCSKITNGIIKADIPACECFVEKKEPDVVKKLRDLFGN